MADLGAKKNSFARSEIIRIGKAYRLVVMSRERVSDQQRSHPASRVSPPRGSAYSRRQHHQPPLSRTASGPLQV